MLNLSDFCFYRDRKVPRVILENWESLAVWYVINLLKFMYKVMYESVSSYNYLYNQFTRAWKSNCDNQKS